MDEHECREDSEAAAERRRNRICAHHKQARMCDHATVSRRSGLLSAAGQASELRDRSLVMCPRAAVGAH